MTTNWQTGLHIQCLYTSSILSGAEAVLDNAIATDALAPSITKTTTDWMQINKSLSGVPDYFGRNKISSGGDLSHYSSASLY